MMRHERRRRAPTDGVRAPSPASNRDLTARPPARPAQAAYARRLPHLQPEQATIFITFATWQRWILPPAARDLALHHIVRDHEVTFVVRAAVVMPDHVHMLASPLVDPSGDTYGIAQILQRIKGSSSHAINAQLGGRGRVWQPEYFDRVLRRDERLRAAAEYICENPERASLIEAGQAWRWLWREWIEGREGKTAGGGARAPFEETEYGPPVTRARALDDEG